MSRYKVSLIVGSNFFSRKRVHHLFTFEFVVVKLILHDSTYKLTHLRTHSFGYIQGVSVDNEDARNLLKYRYIANKRTKIAHGR